MQVFVKSLAGNTLALNVNQQSSVANVKALVEAREGIPSGSQCLSFAGKSLVNGGLLDFGVQDNSTLHLNAELLGGGKKRKKKTYTTPKKIKHKRKKVKMAVLKFYKVDDAGKITRLRRECPTATCGAGVFMAWHSDRQYCGKCHLTYVFKKVISKIKCGCRISY
jgi:small subunit ribosomal protein S27Ae